MATLQEFQTQLRNLQNKKIQLSTRLEELVKQDAELRNKLTQMGVTDPNAALASMTQEAEALKVSIQSALAGFQA